MKVLHLSGEYPDATRSGTQAIKRLVACAGDFSDNHVLSLHRQAAGREPRIQVFEDHSIVRVPGRIMPWGYRRFLHRVTDAISSAGLDRGYGLAHAHKLTLEGWVARRLWERTGLEYVVSVRATDVGVLRCKPHMRGAFRRIVAGARGIAVVAPWLIQPLRNALGRRWFAEHEQRLMVLGNLVDGANQWRASHNGRYAMVLRLNASQLARKNIQRTLLVVRRLKRLGCEIELDVFGGGSGEQTVATWVRRLRLDANVRLHGTRSHADVLACLPEYKALVLFSFPETFGLVYLEALRSGIPLLHARHTGVDGLFPDHPVAAVAGHRSKRAMLRAFLDMERGHASYKQAVRNLQNSGQLERYASQGYAETLRLLYGVPVAATHPDVPTPRRTVRERALGSAGSVSEVLEP